MSLALAADLVARGDPDRFRAAMAAPVPARRVLFPLYAFNLEVARASWVSREPLIVAMRLQWWRDALAEIAAGGPVRRHAVTDSLAAVLDPEGAATLGALIDAREADVERAPFADEPALLAYLGATAGGLMWTAARLLRAPAAQEEAVRAVGAAAGMAAWLAALPQLEAAGKAPLPPDARPEALAADALRWLEAVRPAPGAGWPALLPAAAARARLRRLAAGRPAPGEALTRGLMLRAALLRRF